MYVCVYIILFYVTANVYEVKYIVDFDSMLAEIVSETKYMEQLGFSVPELARNVALQVSSFILQRVRAKKV